MTKALKYPLNVPLRCRCGHMSGVASHVSSSTGFRLVCYGKDCQAFAHFLDRRDVLDAAGGTDIFQMPPWRVRLTTGTDAMRCLQLSNKVLRWYTACCHTPIANTAASPRFPVIGVIHSSWTTRAAIGPATKFWAHRSAAFTKALPSGRSHRAHQVHRP